MNELPIAVGNDHGGYQMKLEIIAELQRREIAFLDYGSHSTDIVRYPRQAAQVCNAIVKGVASRGILICSTGIGMSIIANRYPGIRASLCHSTYTGRMTRAHNNSNVLCLGGKTTGIFEALDILAAWLDTPYEGGRHSISLGLITEAEFHLHQFATWSPSNDESDLP